MIPSLFCYCGLICVKLLFHPPSLTTLEKSSRVLVCLCDTWLRGSAQQKESHTSTAFFQSLTPIFPAINPNLNGRVPAAPSSVPCTIFTARCVSHCVFPGCFLELPERFSAPLTHCCPPGRKAGVFPSVFGNMQALQCRTVF